MPWRVTSPIAASFPVIAEVAVIRISPFVDLDAPAFLEWAAAPAGIAYSEPIVAAMQDPEGSSGHDQTNHEHDSLKYSLLGPSLTKPGQDNVDQTKVAEVIYNASRGSKFFNNEEVKDKILTEKIGRILAKKAELERLDLAQDLHRVDEYVAQLELERDLSQTVVHIDCDAFYAAVEALDRPELNDVPFAVGAGVLSTCNYHARKFGCRSGMAGFVAKKLCPQLVLIPMNFEKYTAKAREVREILAEYDPRFESSSIDEAYLNITAYCDANRVDPNEAVDQLRRKVHEKTKVTVSAGIAANTRLAKICSNMNKPNGQFRVANDRESIMGFMQSLPVRKINGVGRVFERELGAIGVKTCGDIHVYRQYLARLFGDKAYQFLMQCFLGLGRTKVQPAEEYERKSIGTESTFGDLDGHAALREKLRQTAEELEKDMLRAGLKGRTLILKVKLHTYEVYTRQINPPKAVQSADDLYKYAAPMLARLEQDIPGMRLRLMGLRCSHLASAKKPDAGAFFGFKRGGDAAAAAAAGGPDAAKHVLACLTDEESEDARGELEEAPERRHGRETAAPDAQADAAGWWSCPICLRPHVAAEKAFNEHIDLCLSRPVIREALQDAAAAAAADGTPDTTTTTATTAASQKPRSRPVEKRARGGAPVVVDPRQKRLCFTPPRGGE